jgi:hypothetical protein
MLPVTYRIVHFNPADQLSYFSIHAITVFENCITSKFYLITANGTFPNKLRDLSL